MYQRTTEYQAQALGKRPSAGSPEARARATPYGSTWPAIHSCSPPAGVRSRTYPSSRHIVQRQGQGTRRRLAEPLGRSRFRPCPRCCPPRPRTTAPAPAAVCECLSLWQWHGNPRHETRRRRRKMTTASLSLALLPVQYVHADPLVPTEASRVPLRPRIPYQLVARTLVFLCRDSTNGIDSAFRRASERDFKFESIL